MDVYSFGSIPSLDIMVGAADPERVAQTSQDLRTEEQSWEFVTGFWFSRSKADYLSNADDVLVGLTRQHLSSDFDVFVVLCASGSARGGGLGDKDPIRMILDRDRAARAELGFAPLPEEFASWLLDGTPASVGDGTFRPLFQPVVD